MRIFLISVFLCLCSLSAYTQDFSVNKIPENLKKDAYAVIRYEECDFVQTDINNATEKNVRVITVLDEKGKDLAFIQFSQDKFRKLKNFSGEIILESGKVFKKIGKGDLNTTEMSSEWVSDDKFTYYACEAPTYPYTVKYSYEIKWDGGVPYYPTFAPAMRDASVEKSVHRIQIPPSLTIRYKGNEFAPKPVESTLKGNLVYEWTSENVAAITSEPFGPSYADLTPLVYIAPNSFSFDGIRGNMDTWQTCGMFLTKLIENRNILPQTTIDKVKEMATDDKIETVKRIYSYLQSSVRYVSIQLGIGGYQPIPAMEVAKTGFGDCKALTNYMKAMLDVVGIKSEYTVIRSGGKKDMFPDFSSLTQANHVILCVPMENDTIWLECTTRDYPFNYVHSGISGHDALLVSGENSRLCRLRNTVQDALNTESHAVKMKIQKDGTAIFSVNSKYINQEVEGKLNFVLYMKEKDRINSLTQGLSASKSQIRDINSNYIKSENPEVDINYTVEASMYANKTGSRLFVPTNPFKSNYGRIFYSTSRKNDIVFNYPICETDTITIEIPEGMQIETMPNPVNIETAFGTFSSKLIPDGQNITFIYQVTIPTGKYPAASYAEIKDFFGQIGKNYSGGRLVLKEK